MWKTGLETQCRIRVWSPGSQARVWGLSCEIRVFESYWRLGRNCWGLGSDLRSNVGLEKTCAIRVWGFALELRFTLKF